jgi:hypothetical protein
MESVYLTVLTFAGGIAARPPARTAPELHLDAV